MKQTTKNKTFNELKIVQEKENAYLLIGIRSLSNKREKEEKEELKLLKSRL
jgi:hypothetical protein